MNTTQIEPVTILLVDDRPENLISLMSVLDEPGYRLLTAASGSEALRLVLKEKPAVILLDVVMPIMDGLEVASLIKARERSRHIPIIFLTAAAADLDRIYQAYSMGAIDYLIKPVAPEVVRAKISVFVELHRRREEVKHEVELTREHDRRELERRIAGLRAASDRRYRDLAEAIPQLVWRATSDGAVYFVSRRWCDYTGMAAAASEGWGWLRAIHPADSDGLRLEWLSCLRAQTELRFECRVKREVDGTFNWHVCQARPERETTGEVVGWLGTYTDIELQRQADDKRTKLISLTSQAAPPSVATLALQIQSLARSIRTQHRQITRLSTTAARLLTRRW